MKKIKGIIILVVCAFFLFLSIKAVLGMDDAGEYIRNAVWVEDGKVHAENEGRLVAVVIRPSEWENACDTEMNISFHAPVVRRTVEQLKENNRSWSWKPVYGLKDVSVDNAIFTGAPAAEDDYIIDSDILAGLNAGIQCSENDMTLRENNVSDIRNYGGYTWITSTPADLMDSYSAVSIDDKKAKRYHRFSGSYRWRYSTAEYSSDDTVVFLGIQHGNNLEKDDGLDAGFVYENAESLDSVVSGGSRSVYAGIAVALVICGIVGFFTVKKCFLEKE